jgi:hypothetical protein
MKQTTTPKLRARSLDTDALRKASGGAGNRCGSSYYCSECGTYICDVGMEMYYVSGYGYNCYNCGSAL